MKIRDQNPNQRDSCRAFVYRITRGYSLLVLLLALFVAAMFAGGKFLSYVGAVSGLLVLCLTVAKVLVSSLQRGEGRWIASGPSGPDATGQEGSQSNARTVTLANSADQMAAELWNDVQRKSESSLGKSRSGDPIKNFPTENPPAAVEAHSSRRGVEIRPLEDRVVVRQLPQGSSSLPGLILPDSAKEKPHQGEVIALEPPGGEKAHSVSVGDHVVFDKTGGDKITIGDEEFHLLREEDILEVVAPASRPAGQVAEPTPQVQGPQQQRQQQQQQLGEPARPERSEIAPELATWIEDAPAAASLPLQPSLIPRLWQSKIQRVHHSAQSPDTIRLLYGTDRARKISPRGVVGYSWRRGNRLDRGICWVSIPPENQHKTGALEGPSWFKLQFAFNPKKHITLHEIAPLERDLWLDHVRWLGANINSKQLLIFVHGYNVTFRDAARRTGQFVYDLGFGGVPMFYSWPSCGLTLLYPFDEAAVQNAESHFQAFIEDALQSGDFESAIVVAHSMGNRVMAAALERVIRKTTALGATIRHVILAAPDIDTGYFRDTVAPNLLALGLKMTMYVSARDRALVASRWFHGGPRVGDAKKAIVVIPGIDTIDASNVDTSFVGHSPFADRRELLSDIHYLIEGQGVGTRYGLDQLQIKGVKYYKFRR